MAVPVVVPIPVGSPALTRIIQLQFTDISPWWLFAVCAFMGPDKSTALTPSGPDNGNGVNFDLELTGQSMKLPGIPHPVVQPFFSFQCDGGLHYTAPPSPKPAFTFSVRELTPQASAAPLVIKDYFKGMAGNETEYEIAAIPPPLIQWGVKFPLILTIGAQAAGLAPAPVGARAAARRAGGE
jgi:hypothetical protein